MSVITASWSTVVHNPRLPDVLLDEAMTRNVARCVLLRHCGARRPLRGVKPLLFGITALVLELILGVAAAANPTLVSVIVRGSTVYDAPALFEVYRGELGKPISSDGVRAIAAALVAKYEGDGYSRPQVKARRRAALGRRAAARRARAANQRSARQRRSGAAPLAARATRLAARGCRPRHAGGRRHDVAQDARAARIDAERDDRARRGDGQSLHARRRRGLRPRRGHGSAQQSRHRRSRPELRAGPGHGERAVRR